MSLGLSVTFITLNEEQHIEAALKSVSWADEIIVVDSGSQDRTVEIARQNGAQVFTNSWPGYGQQKNFAHEKARGPWVLNIDADERVSPQLAQEIQSAIAQPGDAQGFSFPRKTYYLGRWIRHGGWYPNVLARLGRKDHTRWSEPPVHEELLVDGPVRTLVHPLDHYAFSSIQEQVLTTLRYSRLGSERLKQKGQRPNLLKLLIKPLGKFLETYFLKRGFLDGLAGFIISINAAHSLFLKYAYLFESELSVEDPNHR